MFKQFGWLTKYLLSIASHSSLQIAVIALLVASLISGLPAGSATANTNWVLQFDGATDQVTLHKTVDMIGADWATAKTVTLWVLPFAGNTCAGPDAALCDAILGDQPHYWGISVGLIPSGHHGGQDRIWVFNENGGEDLIGIPYTPGEWVYIALVHDGVTLSAYKNGVLAGSTPSGPTGQAQGESKLYLGGVLGTEPRLFAGLLDDVKIWDFALSSSEISDQMYLTLSGNEPGLAAYYQMSDGTGTSLTDNSQYDWTGTLVDGGGAPGPLWVVRDEWVPPTAPAAPSDLMITGTSFNLVDLAWMDNSTDEYSFEIERCTGEACSDFALVGTVLDNVTTFTDIAVAPSTHYCYRVLASNSGGDSTYTNVACALTKLPLYIPFITR